MNITDMYNRLDEVLTDTQSALAKVEPWYYSGKLDFIIDTATQACESTNSTKHNILCSALCMLYATKYLTPEEIDDMLPDLENLVKLQKLP